MGIVKKTLLLFCSLFLPFVSLAQIFSSHNHYDKVGLRHGRWKDYSDNTHKKYFSKGRYRHDIKVGKWKYYTTDGKLEKKEKFRKHGKLMLNTYYHKNGKVSSRGKAELVIEGDMLHYYWFGEWKYYNEMGNYEKSKIFLMGKELRTVYPEKMQ